MRSLAAILATALISAPLPAMAELPLEPGQHFRVVHDYDYDTNQFLDTPPKGEGEACFVITSVDLQAPEIGFRLLSGPYHPWWSETPFDPGHTDSFVPATGFMEKNPSANWTDLLHQILAAVPSCPKETSRLLIGPNIPGERGARGQRPKNFPGKFFPAETNHANARCIGCASPVHPNLNKGNPHG